MKFTTAYHYVKTKMDRNKYLIEVFEIESKIAKLEMVIRLRLLKQNEKYVETLKNINEIESMQLYEYSLDREKEVKILTDIINNTSLSVDDIKKDIIHLSMKCAHMLSMVNILNSAIPNNISVYNYSDPELLEHQKSCGY